MNKSVGNIFKFVLAPLTLVCVSSFIFTQTEFAFAQTENELPIWHEKKGDPHAISVQTVTYNKQLKDYDYEVTYPFFSCKLPEAEAALGQVNFAIRSMVNKDMEQQRAALPVTEGKVSAGKRYSCSCNYRISWATTSFISIAFDFYSYSGGNHGLTYGRAFNYCLNPMRKLTLANLLGAKDPYKRISDLCRLHLYRSLKNSDPDKFVDKGTEPIAGNFENFTFDDKGVQIIFQLYQVAPYSEGMPFVSLSYGELMSLISPLSPVHRFVAGTQKDESLSDEQLKKELEIQRKAFKKRMERI